MIKFCLIRNNTMRIVKLLFHDLKKKSFLINYIVENIFSTSKNRIP